MFFAEKNVNLQVPVCLSDLQPAEVRMDKLVELLIHLNTFASDRGAARHLKFLCSVLKVKVQL